MWNTAGLISINPLVALVDIFEEAAAGGRRVVKVTGADVAAFADDLAQGEPSYKDKQRQKLNKSLAGKLKN